MYNGSRFIKVAPLATLEAKGASLIKQPGTETITIAGAENIPSQVTNQLPALTVPLTGVILLHLLGSCR